QMPSIVVLLVAGVLLGPDVAGLVQPEQLGAAIHMLVGFAVAVILFEGGMNLDIHRLRQEALAIRRLVTVGALITAVGAALAARLLMGWDWRLSAVFGALMIVTGPTVVTPLLRRLRVKDPVNTVLQAEGVLIDSIGAIIAVVTLEVAFAGGASMEVALGGAAIKLGMGAAIGLAAGLGISLILGSRSLIPSGFQNILVLSFVVALFQLSETIQPESGLAAVTVAGVVVGGTQPGVRRQTRVRRELFDFKEQLTVLMIGLLFVLLAADVRLGNVSALGWRAGATVAALMLVVRPVQAFLCTLGSSLSWRERLFIALLAPRGVVAAAIASLFAAELTVRGTTVGGELQALVFLVIAVTVTVHGLTGGWIAKWLGLRRPTGNGYVILGANALARALGGVLRDDGHEVVLIDSNAEQVLDAELRRFHVIHGQGLQTGVLARAEVDSRLGCIGLTQNEEINLLFVKQVREETREPLLYVALRGHASVLPDHAHEAHASVLFGGGRDVDEWVDRLELGSAHVQHWRRSAVPQQPAPTDPSAAESPEDWLLFLAVQRRGRMRPFDDETQLGAKEEVAIVIREDRAENARAWLRARQWEPVTAPRDEPADNSVLAPLARKQQFGNA
ncbi:MAG: cation:proton antiporter, partial [Longimicrobiales bacterium]